MRSIYLYLKIIFTCLLISSCAGVSIEHIKASNMAISPDNWDIGFQTDRGWGKGTIREWVPKGESINNWSRLLTIEFIENDSRTPLEFAHDLRKLRTKQCPGTKWNLIKEENNSIYYKFNFPDCMGYEAQSEVTRLFKGKDGLHRLSYAEKGTSLKSSIINYWVKEFQKAFLSKN